jgi:ABC-type multidrug transport system fused ATPase/permease subunit
MDFFRLVLRFIPEYKGRITAYVLMNFIASVFSVFSFIALIPLIQLLFGLSDKTFEYVDTQDLSSFNELLDAAKNNIMYYLQEQMAVHGKTWVLFAIGGFVVLMSFLFNIVSYFAYWVRIPIRTGISRSLRQDAYNRIVNMPVLAFSKENRGDFVSRMTSDVDEIDFGIGTTLDMFIKDPIQIIVYIATMVSISSNLTMYGMALLLVTCSLILYLGRIMQRITFQAQTNRGKILSMYEQTIGVLPVVKSYSTEHDFSDKFSVLNYDTQRIFNKQNRFYSLAWSCTDFSLVAIIVMILCISGELILKGESAIGPATLIAFLGVFYSLIAPMRDLMKCTFGIRKAMASLERLNRVLRIEQESDSAREELVVRHTDEPIIELRGVSFRYENDDVLKKVSIKVKDGEKIAILGSTGSGKSTLAGLISQLYSQNEGVILINGKDVSTYSVSSVRKNISYVVQDPLLIQDSIFYNITLGNREYSKEDVIRAARKAHIHDFIMGLPLQYETIIGDRGTLLSSGQKQCIALARAFIKDAPIYIMDEATSALDPELETLVLKELSDGGTKSTAIIITHRISTSLDADYVYVIDDGRIVEEGTPKQVLGEDGLYSSLAVIQNIRL